ncbi:MAG: deoxyribonuclease [Archaeoglobi archaeon]|nr:deoxyribonuclease [Archaeoglobi archaeon]MDK2781805.1 deoxyribonuclease [Archaeoglobi archaeon]
MEERWAEEQRRLSERVILEDEDEPQVFCGVATSSFKNEIICSAVVMREEKVIEERTLRNALKAPYIPSFRFYSEGEALMKLISSLKSSPDIFIFKASGIAHPRFLGLASHIGVLMNIRTVGVTKKSLIGKIPELKENEFRILNYLGKEVGIAVKFSKKHSPLLISPGHRISLMGAFEVVKKLMRGNSLPEPLMIARRVARRERLNMASQK